MTRREWGCIGFDSIMSRDLLDLKVTQPIRAELGFIRLLGLLTYWTTLSFMAKSCIINIGSFFNVPLSLMGVMYMH